MCVSALDMDVTLRYVVLRHDSIPEPHFDVMFETSPGSPLVTFRSADWPVRSETRLMRLAEHREAYLDYEGPIAGNRGVVRRVEAGRCIVTLEPDASISVTLANGTRFGLMQDRVELKSPDAERLKPNDRGSN